MLFRSAVVAPAWNGFLTSIRSRYNTAHDSSDMVMLVLRTKIIRPSPVTHRYHLDTDTAAHIADHIHSIGPPPRHNLHEGNQSFPIRGLPAGMAISLIAAGRRI